MRIIFFYLICLLVMWRILDYQKLSENAVPQTLSRLTPPIDYFTEFVNKQDHYDPYKLMYCVNYHQAVAQFFTIQRAEAYGMLGFCYERLGQSSQAVNAYQKAIALNPDYFWPYFNLGIMAYKQSQYTQAANYFHQALGLEPIKTIVLLSRSKVYNDVRLSQEVGSYDYLQGLKEGQTEGYMLMMRSLYHLSHPQMNEDKPQDLKLRARFF